MIIYLNRNANNGTAGRKWDMIEDSVRKKVSDMGEEVEVVETPRVDDIVSWLRADIERRYMDGERVFVAAGGDGSVHAVANAILSLGKDVILGAISLGSSNDFHKPFRADREIAPGIYARIDFTHPQRQNAARVRIKYHDNERERYFVINSSMGVLAEGNDLFNRGDFIIRFLKHRNVQATINYAAIKTILTYRNFPATLVIDGFEYNTWISNLSVFINPHFTGSFKYDLPITPHGEYMGVALCENMNFFRRINTLRAISKGHFSSLPGTRWWRARRVEILPERVVAYEMDGEVFRTTGVSIELLKGGIKVCS